MMSNQRSVLESYIGSAPVGGVGHGALLPLWLAIESSWSALDGLRISAFLHQRLSTI